MKCIKFLFCAYNWATETFKSLLTLYINHYNNRNIEICIFLLFFIISVLLYNGNLLTNKIVRRYVCLFIHSFEYNIFLIWTTVKKNAKYRMQFLYSFISTFVCTHHRGIPFLWAIANAQISASDWQTWQQRQYSFKLFRPLQTYFHAGAVWQQGKQLEKSH